MQKRPTTTLFMLESLDGKISTGSTDNMDVDKDFPKIPGIKEGLHQYYKLEAETDLFSLNTGRVMAKIGVNDKTKSPEKINTVTFIIIDNKPHLTQRGINYICNWVGKLILVTTNQNHPAFAAEHNNLEILYYKNLNLNQMLEDIYSKYNAGRLTIQSGGTLNCAFLRAGLIDYVNIIIAPALIGGKNTATLIDGESLSNETELQNIKTLELQEINKLNNSYIQLKYKVNN